MMNVMLSADEALVEAAHARARAEHTTLNEMFCRWLTEYVGPEYRVARYERVMDELRGKIKTGGRKFTRDEMNER